VRDSPQRWTSNSVRKVEKLQPRKKSDEFP
jgi:hypothetical protein